MNLLLLCFVLEICVVNCWIQSDGCDEESIHPELTCRLCHGQPCHDDNSNNNSNKDDAKTDKPALSSDDMITTDVTGQEYDAGSRVELTDSTPSPHHRIVVTDQNGRQVGDASTHIALVNPTPASYVATSLHVLDQGKLRLKIKAEMEVDRRYKLALSEANDVHIGYARELTIAVRQIQHRQENSTHALHVVLADYHRDVGAGPKFTIRTTGENGGLMLTLWDIGLML